MDALEKIIPESSGFTQSEKDTINRVFHHRDGKFYFHFNFEDFGYDITSQSVSEITNPTLKANFLASIASLFTVGKHQKNLIIADKINDIAFLSLRESHSVLQMFNALEQITDTYRKLALEKIIPQEKYIDACLTQVEVSRKDGFYEAYFRQIQWNFPQSEIESIHNPAYDKLIVWFRRKKEEEKVIALQDCALKEGWDIVLYQKGIGVRSKSEINAKRKRIPIGKVMYNYDYNFDLEDSHIRRISTLQLSFASNSDASHNIDDIPTEPEEERKQNGLPIGCWVFVIILCLIPAAVKFL